ncbi:Trk system potassium transport protein TrkA [Iodidimonas gelatinilytica]|uniref:Trk system potassium uptake protein TrkA n=1 Tax=Iodidimonas gelatinilytica TaxID=1236966 RepID=A0A5A7MNZ1_9PROT|nr:Trk system potassium transporter TrkA [Iodidimonas gelatinilytica]GEQ96735.1 Trk system potassium transport protein TrkA [Iodidimonas gelatinilytica]GER01458.1 Trk system potassium transport protein TrkA [Iodidimonas gelatinilytica]
MKVIVCGAGQVGLNIARYLAGQKNDVTIIDRSAKLIRKVGEMLDVQALEGHASDPNLLEQAGLGDADMIIAVTISDEVNMVACQIAHSLFNVPTKIARIRNQSYLDPQWSDLFTRDNLPIDVVISPEVEVADAIYRRLEVPGAFDTLPFSDDKVRVLGLRLDEHCPVVETPLRQLTELFPDLRVRVLAIMRGGKLFVPLADDHMEVGDGVYIAVETKHVARAMGVFGHEEEAARRIVVIGGGAVGLNLARRLENRTPRLNVKIIEYDEERAAFVADKMSRTVVIHGDALDPEILREANVSEAETVVAVTNEDEVNILATLLAKQNGCARAVTLINNTVYGPLIDSMGIDVHVDPREMTVSTILRHIRRGRIRDLHSIGDGAAEVIEAEILEASSVAGKSLRQVKFPRGVVVGAIARGSKVIVPRGETVFEPGDRVVVLALTESVKTVEQLFSVHLEFF